MATTGRKKRTAKTSDKKRATARGKTKAPPPAPEVADTDSSVQQALAVTQKQIDGSLQEIRREMASFQSQVMTAIETVQSEQARGLDQVRRAMEGALPSTGKKA